ncbi:DUF418 domain-containing protein [Mycolicibacterium boenickei]|uniref:DUF418 domain-containing protein n=1 Tax=Mycolicibacterium boenickei TaxID=146017 RepID=A0AAX3A4T9_9MYCO|nr:DUF418 domain-containing protein [Mycolicibacterium boenickei]PEG61609.1 DUF418 domain-containing protein [Mycolicibacterium boenickei]UNC02183.1 DUF418 domain-containing protein [Mycolicibacterium boenickei]BBX92148.1 hypothetical protein MBOE_37970 [Mycolicibacterium boenickei]
MSSTRLQSLDVLRGIAILGTLGTNIWIFTDPEGLIGYLNGPPDSPWWPVEIGLQLLAQGKFLGLLTVMFGIGLALQQRSALRAGLRWPGSYPWRALLLLVDGIVHFVLFTEFDVLTGYAITGWIVSYLLVTSPRAQRRIIAGAAAVHIAMLTAITVALLSAAGGTGASQPLDPNPYADGSFWDLVAFRLDHVLLFRLETLLIFPMSIALFLLGARLFHAGVLEARGTVLRRRLIWLGFAVAAPLDVALEVAGGGPGLILARYGVAPFVSMGILAVVAEFYTRRPAPGWAGRRLAEVGRMALSSYVLQNVLASAICYGWGFGLAAATPTPQRVPVTVAVYLVVVAVVTCFAHLWLRRFRRGPVEWLWNTSYRALADRTRERRPVPHPRDGNLMRQSL